MFTYLRFGVAVPKIGIPVREELKPELFERVRFTS